MLQRQFLIFFYFLLNVFSFSQNPSYIKIGEDELSGIDIYSICQSNDKSIWLTSNKGIIKYDGYSYKFLPNDHLKAQSSFNILKNSKGELFCFNLFGQILKVEEDSVILFSELPDSLVFSRYEMELLENDQLLLRSDKNILIDQSGKIKVVPKDVPNLAHNSVANKIMECYSIRETTKSNIYHTPNLFVLFQWDGKKFNEFKMDTKHIPSNSVTHMSFRSKDGYYFFTVRNGGIYAFHQNGKPAYNGHHLYKDYQISGFLEDYEGNLWLTTLGKGILLIKNHKIISYRDHELLKNQSIVVSKFHKYGNVYFGTENGHIFYLNRNGEVKEIFDNGSVNIHFIEFYKNYVLSNGGFSIEMIDTNNFTSTDIGTVAAIKESYRIFEREYLFATNQGVFHSIIDKNNRLEDKEIFKIGRCNTILPLKNASDFYAGTTKGLYRVKEKEVTEILFQNSKVIASSIAKNKSHVFAGTTTKGIYELNGNQIVDHITKEKGLLSERILSIKTSGDLLFIASDKGFQVYDINAKSFILPHLNNAINGSKILNFDLRGQELVIVTNNDIQFLSINDIHKNTIPPFIEINHVWIDGSSIDFKESNQFEHDQNKFEFEFIGKSYGHGGKLQYKYRLFPLDEEWEFSEYLNNKAKYGLLSPGKYTFQIVAINENGVESEIKEYQFEILKPYWQTWWFYLIISISISGLVIVVWRIQLNRIRKKNQKEKELIGSKLTALKLQMNPHFIFNALNSIQDLILKQDTDNSYDYIVKFSSLVRRILNYSDKEFIEIEEEIEILQLYLELENLRFSKDFHFEIRNNIDQDIRIPSMLIQPFVENCVKHGLLHKKGAKNLKITFEINDVVSCIIEDNGIGIERSKEINARKKHKHASVSIQSIKNRIEILKEYYKSDLGIEFINLYENEEPSGTRVILKLPYENTY